MKEHQTVITPAEEVPELPLKAEALAFLRDVMRGAIPETKTIIYKTTIKTKSSTEETVKETYKSKSFEVPAELETRQKAAERILKYTANKLSDNGQTQGIVILPKTEITEGDVDENND